MKQTILLFISFLILKSAFSQNIETFLIETRVNETWVKMANGGNTYDQVGFLINTSQNTWDNDYNQWNKSFQTLYTNTNEGKVTQQITQSWSDVTRIWDNLQRVTFGYNSDKKLTSKITENAVNGNWQYLTKEVHSYDSPGNIKTKLQFSWNLAISSWEITQQINYTYNTDGNVIEIVTQLWNNSTNTWNNIERTISDYNFNDKPITQVTDLWISGNWQNHAKTTNTYDKSGYLLNSIKQQWNMKTSEWNNSELINYYNNSNGNINQKTIQFWNNLSLLWEYHSRTSYTYFQSNSSSKPQYPGFSVYPNPCNDYISIKLENSDNFKISIVDIQGQAISSQLISGKATSIDLKDLNSGIYILKIEQGEKVLIRKVLKN